MRNVIAFCLKYSKQDSEMQPPSLSTSSKWSEVKWNIFLWSDETKFLFENHESYGNVNARLKNRETIRFIIIAQSKSQHQSWYAGAIVHPAWVTCISVKVLWMLNERGATHAAIQTISFTVEALFTSARLGQTTFCTLPSAWLRSKRVQVLNWPTCSPDLLHYEVKHMTKDAPMWSMNFEWSSNFHKLNILYKQYE